MFLIGEVPLYLAHKKQHLPRTLQSDYAQGPMVALGVGLFKERGDPVQCTQD